MEVIEELITGAPSHHATLWAKTTMPSPLPPEILDLVVDDLRDELTALRACCLASKLWVSRTRRYVFVRIEFQRTENPTLLSWTKTFPDPSNPPARYTARSLTIHGPTVIAIAIMAPRIVPFAT